MQECKLTNVFIQETQSYYLLENLMALARDYAYQLTQNPMMPNLLLSVYAYRDKDKSKGTTGTIIDFNGSLSKQQIVPDDFPLQISGWDIKGGPIFWQDKKKDEDDERYLSEVFMLGELAVDSKLIPNWKARIVQTMEIERNPLCDFHLYAEGDTLINGNITSNDDSWYINFYGPVQINGNTRFPFCTGAHNGRFTFYNKVNLAGHALRIKELGISAASIKIPEKYCFYDNSSFYDGFLNPYTTGLTTFSANPYSTQSTSSSTTQLSNFSNKNTIGNSYDNYEQYLFNTFKGNFMTRGRVYRPCGFDPISDWGFWYPKEGGGVSDEARILDMCFGLHNLCKSSAVASHNLYSNSRASNAAEMLRELDAYQMTEKTRLVETQKAINSPGLEVRLLLKKSADANKDSLRIPVRYPYVTYDPDHFPAKNDNLYLNQYLSLKFQDFPIFDIEYRKNYFNTENYYEVNNSNTPQSQFDIVTQSGKSRYQDIQNNKLIIRSVNTTDLSIDDVLNTIFIDKKGFDLVGFNDPSSPPDKLTDYGNYWSLGSSSSRLHSDPGYQFIYDRNRAKWIQLLDIDIGALKTAVANKNSVFSTWNTDLNRTIKINVYWQGSEHNANINYSNYADLEEDIRLKYITQRETFFKDNNNREFLYSSACSPVVDIGVRLINAEELPEGGMTLVCPYPLYIKGDFNTKNTKYKACLITDSLTILSKDWQDWRSGMDFGNSYLYSLDGKSCNPEIPASTIYAHVITGRTHPNYWLNDSGMHPDFGIHDAFRTLEDISNPIKFYGSLLLPYYCQRQWEPPIDFCHDSRPPAWFAYVPIYLGNKDKEEWTKMRTAPGMPTYLKVNRGRKTQAIGSIVYDSLVNNVRGSKTSAQNQSITAYHSLLPNFLKYPQDP